MGSCTHEAACLDLSGGDWAYSCSEEGCGLRAEGRTFEEALEGFQELAPGFAPGGRVSWSPVTPEDVLRGFYLGSS